MKQTTRSTIYRMAICFIATTFLSEIKLQAYTDPGSGALLWQLLVAGFFGIVYSLRRVVSRVRFKGPVK